MRYQYNAFFKELEIFHRGALKNAPEEINNASISGRQSMHTTLHCSLLRCLSTRAGARC